MSPTWWNIIDSLYLESSLCLIIHCQIIPLHLNMVITFTLILLHLHEMYVIHSLNYNQWNGKFPLESNFFNWNTAWNWQCNDSPTYWKIKLLWNLQSQINTLHDFISKHKTLSLFNSNARSLIKNNSHFQALFDQIHQENIHFDIITFCETWLNDNLCHSVNFEYYNSVF